MMKLKIIFGLMVMMSFTLHAQICPISPGTNLITNGTFQSGCASFLSDYAFNNTCNGGSVGPGQWTVTDNANGRNSFFTNPTGANPPGEPASGNQYLIIDADGTLGKDAWRSTVSVISGTTYFFSAWISNINGTYENPPELKFSINNVQLGANLVASNATHNWQQFYVTWTAPSTGSIDIRLENLITTSNGNDLAIDAINFNTSCSNIPNLNSLGQSSVLPDTVYNCNVEFPYTLNPGLPGSYALAWRKVAGAPLSTAASYNEPPTPADGTKLYLCYEFIPGCPRKDSVIFRTTPLAVELGAPKVMCAPVSITLNSGVLSPPVTVQWLRNGVPVATTANYTATDIGTYTVNLSRAGCGSATDNVTISNPTSTISGTGNYCAANNTADFTVTGSSLVKWYTVASGGTPLNPGNSNPTITTTYAATNTTTPGCTSGLYAEDISSYPGIAYPANPCGTTNNYNGNSEILVEINQTLNLTSVDYYQNAGWGNGTFTFSIFNNGPNAGPWCGPCGANKDGPTGGPIYSTTTAIMTQPGSGSLQRTLATSYTLAPGRYWFRLSASGTAMGMFNCNQTYAANSNLWASPFVDNTGNNVMRVISALEGGNNQSSGALFNLQFQVGNANTCSRLFICAIDNCSAPVELIQFDAKKSSYGNTIIWKTASEQNSAFFVIQRSIDGINFEDIGQVTAAGNSSSILSYSYLDNEATHTGIVYYRLKQVDIDATPHYSDIKSIRNDELSSDVKLYPVPVKRGQNVTLDYITASDETIVVEIFDNPGKVVSEGQFEVQEGANSIELNTASLAPGLYHLRIKGGNNRTAKFIVE
jgi:hypothetical protein